MSKRDPLVPLRQMRDFATEALTLSQGRKRSDLETDRLFGLAMTRLLELIGEAATRVDATYRTANPSVPWRAVVQMRNRLIHGYDHISYDIMWQTIYDDLRPLITELDMMIASHPTRPTTT